jgi:hypothetical protein
MQPESMQGNTRSRERRVWRNPYTPALLVFFGGFTAFFLGVALFGSQNPGLAGIIALLSGVVTADTWRHGLYVEPTGVKLVSPGRLRPRRIPWSEIERFEAHLVARKYPVTLIRAPDHQPINVPTFPRIRNPTPPQIMKKYRVRLQRQVDELNALLAAHRVNAVAEGPSGNGSSGTREYEGRYPARP